MQILPRPNERLASYMAAISEDTRISGSEASVQTINLKSLS